MGVAAAVVDGDPVAPRRVRRLQGRLARERLMGVFAWAEGEYVFDPASHVVTPSIDPIDTVEPIIEAVGKVVLDPTCERFLTQYPEQVLKASDRRTSYLSF